ncbi:MAG: cytochrome c biogenesis protein CcsA [Armatimonadota bacterium]|nr:cytochrome c biogenesis protein CcsA [Armatimonadota bacterium]
MSSLLLGVVLIAYFISAVLYLANLHVKHSRYALFGAVFAAAGFVVHTVRVIVVHAGGNTPFSTAPEALVLVAWAIVLLYLIILWRYRLPAVGALEMPLAVICILLAASVAKQQFASGVISSGWLKVHIVAIILSMAAFAVAFCCAVFYLVQNKLLKSKRLSGMFRRLPPLELIDGLAHNLVAIAFPLLTLGIITAVIGVHAGLLRTETSPVKIAASAVTWATYALYLFSHGVLQWRGRRAHYVLIAGAVAVAVTTALHGFK